MARKNKAIKKEGGVMEGPRSSNGNAVENSKKAKDANKGGNHLSLFLTTSMIFM
jgi:hypothetical protein